MPVTYNSRNPAVKRLMKEAQELAEPTELYFAQPLEDNLFEWHFTIRGPEDSEFQGGIYHGRILLPSEYPMKPPNIVILTPNGRFETHRKICLSISGYHPESWRPSWSIRTALLAIIGFMPTHGVGAIGSLNQPKEERQMLAQVSQSYVCSICGSIKNLLLPLTTASSSMNKEASEAAAQISMMSEEENADKKALEKLNIDQLSCCLDGTSIQSNVPPVNLNTPSKIPTTTTTTTGLPSSTTPSASSVNQGNIVNPSGYVNPFLWPGFSPYNIYPSKTTDTTPQIAYWLCFPVYYPLPISMNSNLLTTNTTSTSQTSSSSSTTTTEERVPLSFSEWLKQIREKEKKTENISTMNTVSGVELSQPQEVSYKSEHYHNHHSSYSIVDTYESNVKNHEKTISEVFSTQKTETLTSSADNCTVQCIPSLPHTTTTTTTSSSSSTDHLQDIHKNDLINSQIEGNLPISNDIEIVSSNSSILLTNNKLLSHQKDIIKTEDVNIDIPVQKNETLLELKYDDKVVCAEGGGVSDGIIAVDDNTTETLDMNIDISQLEEISDNLDNRKIHTTHNDATIKSISSMNESLEIIDNCRKYHEYDTITKLKLNKMKQIKYLLKI
ncbi:unnamed protein product [Heterobilharzia americana]|nr:unnamed protein product [Heterobilharzia americana]